MLVLLRMLFWISDTSHTMWDKSSLQDLSVVSSIDWYVVGDVGTSCFVIGLGEFACLWKKIKPLLCPFIRATSVGNDLRERSQGTAAMCNSNAFTFLFTIAFLFSFKGNQDRCSLHWGWHWGIISWFREMRAILDRWTMHFVSNTLDSVEGVLFLSANK